METVNQLTQRKSKATISSNKEEDCNCKGSNAVPTAELNQENVRVLRLLEQHNESLKRAMEDAIYKLGITPTDGQRFHLTTFKMVSDTEEGVTTIGSYAGACCPDGSYQNCYTEGCDPCDGHY